MGTCHQGPGSRMALPASPTSDTSATMTSPQPPAHLGAHPVGSASMDHGIPRLSPQCPLGRDGHASGHRPYLGLALGVAGELAACGRERGERVSGGRRGGIARGQPTGTPRAGQDGGWHPTLQGMEHLGMGHRLPGHAHAHMDAHTLHTRMHTPGGSSTAQYHVHMHAALGHTPMCTRRAPPVPTCQGACARANPGAQGLTA